MVLADIVALLRLFQLVAGRLAHITYQEVALEIIASGLHKVRHTFTTFQQRLKKPGYALTRPLS